MTSAGQRFSPRELAVKEILVRYNAWVHQIYFPALASFKTIHPAISLQWPSSALFDHIAWKACAKTEAVCRAKGWDPDRYLQALFEKYPRLSRFGGKPKAFQAKKFPVTFLSNKFSQQLYVEWEKDQTEIAPKESTRRRLAEQRTPPVNERLSDLVEEEIASGMYHLNSYWQYYRKSWVGMDLEDALGPLFERFVPPLAFRACFDAEMWREDHDAFKVRQRRQAIGRYLGWNAVAELFEKWERRHHVPIRVWPLCPELAKILHVVCRDCNGTGGVDSGGVDPRGQGIDIPCPSCGKEEEEDGTLLRPEDADNEGPVHEL